MGRVSIDASEVRALAEDMRRIDSRLSRHVRPVVERGAVQIKNDLQAQARKSRSFRGFAPGISYDMRTPGGAYEAEIGPVKGRPGSLANIAYFDTSRGGGTVEDPSATLEREAPKFADALADLAAELALGP